MAKKFSDAPTAAQGGKLGVFGTHLLTKEIRSALEKTPAKAFSEVVETDQGYQIFYVEEIVNTGGKTLEEAIPEIRDKLFADVVDQKYNTWIEDLRKRSHIQILDE
ncbi:MAG: peptidylprolyl isomerase, partial [Desulfobacteraceae bacterium]|jgi:peptidyl-prolyl cis-trans isomerase SurA